VTTISPFSWWLSSQVSSYNFHFSSWFSGFSNVGVEVALSLRGVVMSTPIAFGLIFFIVASMVAANESQSFKITTRRDNDRVDVKTETSKTIFSIQSPSGISHAVIERADEKWPDAVLLRLYLKGMESFKITGSELKLEGSVSLQEGKPVVRLWKDGKEDAPLDAKSPYWIDVRILGGDDQPPKELPLQDGYFEMALPQAIFEGNPKSTTVNWIDFYRN
jgi:hypothetical protein